MSRSVWKGPFVDSYVLKKAEKSRDSGRNEVIKIWSRRSTILPQFVGLTFGVYNGKKHIPVNVTEDMIGQKFGEYSPTRTYYGHAADKKAKHQHLLRGELLPEKIGDDGRSSVLAVFARQHRPVPEQRDLECRIARPSRQPHAPFRRCVLDEPRKVGDALRRRQSAHRAHGLLAGA
jgi:small subunit ribosomal protein S19